MLLHFKALIFLETKICELVLSPGIIFYLEAVFLFSCEILYFNKILA